MSLDHGIVLERRIGFARHTMSKFNLSGVFMRKATIAVVASLAFGIAIMAIGTMALARGGGGHFGGGFGGGHLAGGFGTGHFDGGFAARHFDRGFGGHFAGGRFGRGFRNGFEGLYGFGSGGLYYDHDYSDCYVLTPSGYAWVCY
jgi:hypothetical protein